MEVLGPVGPPVVGCQFRSGLSYWSRNLYKRIKRSLGIINIAEYHRYQAPTIFALLGNLGFMDLELRVFAMSSNGDYHSYFFARKP